MKKKTGSILNDWFKLLISKVCTMQTLTSLLLPVFVAYITIKVATKQITVSSDQFNKGYNAGKIERLTDKLEKIEDINFQYPFIEDSTFIAWWNNHKHSNNDSALRYTTYCERVFNFIQELSEYYDYDKKKIQQFVDVKALIKTHLSWWQLPITDTVDVAPYPDSLINLIKYYSR